MPRPPIVLHIVFDPLGCLGSQFQPHAGERRGWSWQKHTHAFGDLVHHSWFLPTKDCIPFCRLFLLTILTYEPISTNKGFLHSSCNETLGIATEESAFQTASLGRGGCSLPSSGSLQTFLDSISRCTTDCSQSRAFSPFLTCLRSSSSHSPRHDGWKWELNVGHVQFMLSHGCVEGFVMKFLGILSHPIIEHGWCKIRNDFV